MPGYTPPKPDGQRRRRNATVPMTQLPAEGRKGPAPKHPFREALPEELAWWKKLWKLPQAVAWERHNLALSVARYCRILAVFEAGSTSAPVMAECRQLEDRLGLNPLALMRLRWEVSADELGERRVEKATPAHRPRAVDPGAAVEGR